MRNKLTGSFPSMASIHNFLSPSERAWKVTGVFLWKQKQMTLKRQRLQFNPSVKRVYCFNIQLLFLGGGGFETLVHIIHILLAIEERQSVFKVAD